MVEIRRLDASQLEDFLSFMDGPAFESFPKWAKCYCQFYLDSNQLPTPQQDAVRNRRMACERVADGTMNGYLAYDGNSVIGWMAANQANNFKLLPPTDPSVARILCINVQKQHQNRGIATSLLDFALKDLPLQGFTSVEAAPLASGEFLESGYRGPLSMYLKAGFEVGPALDDKHVIVHRKLTANLSAG